MVVCQVYLVSIPSPHSWKRSKTPCKNTLQRPELLDSRLLLCFLSSRSKGSTALSKTEGQFYRHIIGTFMVLDYYIPGSSR